MALQIVFDRPEDLPFLELKVVTKQSIGFPILESYYFCLVKLAENELMCAVFIFSAFDLFKSRRFSELAHNHMQWNAFSWNIHLLRLVDSCLSLVCGILRCWGPVDVHGDQHCLSRVFVLAWQEVCEKALENFLRNSRRSVQIQKSIDAIARNNYSHRKARENKRSRTFLDGIRDKNELSDVQWRALKR